MYEVRESTLTVIQEADKSIAAICAVMELMQGGCEDLANGEQFSNALIHFRESLDDVRMKLDHVMAAFHINTEA